MFAINQMSAWTRRCLNYLTTDSTDSGDWPTVDEIAPAVTNAYGISSRLHTYRRLINHHFPHRTDVIRLIDCTLQALRDDHGGLLPGQFLEMWYRKFSKNLNDHSVLATLEEKKGNDVGMGKMERY